MKFKLEYIWLDGYEPVPNLRSKTKIVDFETEPTLEQLPLWNFDGSSTRQADGSSSDCFLQPVALFPDPARNHGHLVMCEVLLPDGTPHPTNTRAEIADDPDAWFGFEQEYFLYQDGTPRGGSSTSTSTSASRRASRSRASTPRSQRDSGSSRSSARAPSAPPTSSGSRAT